MNTLQMVGKVLQVTPPTGNNNSAKITIQYNVKRQGRKNASRQYINACELRVPEKSLKQLEGIIPGMIVQVLGRIQGVISQSPMGAHTMYCEAVASRIEPWRLVDELVTEGSLGTGSPNGAGNGAHRKGDEEEEEEPAAGH